MARGRRWWSSAAAGTVVILTLVLGACSGTGDDSDSDSVSSAESAGGGSAAGDTGGVTGAGPGGLGDAAPGAQPISRRSQAEDREVIYTADLVVRVGDVEAATEDAVRLAEDAGGLLFEQRSDLDGDQGTELVLKVPPEELDRVLTALADLGTQLQRHVRAEDVTEQVVDLDGRLASAEASADRLRTLLAEATTSTALVEIEAELARRESEIESLQGQLRVLNSQVELATIDVELTPRGDVEVSDDLPGFLAGLRTGWVALVTLGLVMLLVLGFLLPFAPIGGVAWWFVRRRGRWGRRRPRSAGPAGPSPGPPPPDMPPAPAPTGAG